MNHSSDGLIVEALGWMLVHSLWLLVVPTVLLAFVLTVLPSTWSRWRYAAGLVSLPVMFFLPASTLLWIDLGASRQTAGLNAEPLRAATVSSNDGSTPSAEEMGVIALEPRLPVDTQPPRDGGVPVANGDQGDAAIVEFDLLANADREVHALKEPNVPHTQAANTITDRIRPWLSWLVAGWFAGTLLMASRLLLGWLSTRRVRRSGQSSVPEAVQHMFNELRVSIGASKAARVALSTLVKVPSVVGHFRPLVLLPVAAVTGLSEQQLRAILAHELAHVRRYDYAVNIFQTVIETLLFYHPAIWWVSRVVRIEREHCCDDIALGTSCDASELAKALVAVDAVRSVPEKTIVPAADGGSLLHRVRRLSGLPRDDRLARKSWMAGLLAMSLLCAVLFLAALPVTGAAGGGESQSTHEESDQDSHVDASRIDIEGGYSLELAAIGELAQEDGSESITWNAAGERIKRPFVGIRSGGLDVDGSQIVRKLYVRGRWPQGTKQSLSIDGKELGGGAASSRVNGAVEIESSAIATLPADRQTVDMTVELELPAWRTLASFDFAGGVNNGIRMEWERKVTPHTRLTATGNFGPNTSTNDVRIVAFDREHQPLTAARTGSKASGDLVTQLTAEYENSKGRPDFIVVQRRSPSGSIVFRDVPLRPGVDSRVQAEVPGALIVPGVSQPQPLIVQADSKPLPLDLLLEEPRPTLMAELKDAGQLRLIGVRKFGDKGPGWHADGSPMLAPIDADIWSRDGRLTKDDRQHLEVVFEFEPATADVPIGLIRVMPDDGTGTMGARTLFDERERVDRVVVSQSLEILTDRETDDFAVDVFAGPWSLLEAVSVRKPPADFAAKIAFTWQPDASLDSFAFQSSEPRTLSSGDIRQGFMVVLSAMAPQGFKLTGITADGRRVKGRSGWASGRRLAGSFALAEGEEVVSIEVATQPKHSAVFRNVSLWPGLGSSAFIDHPSVAPFEDLGPLPTPSRVFLRPNGERFAEDAKSQAATQALREIERRGGLFRFDAEAEAPSGETLPYLTEVRWDGFRNHDLELLRPLAGLTRLQLATDHLTDEGLVSIEHLTALRDLTVAHTGKLTTQCLHSIGKLTSLRELLLPGTLRPGKGYDPDDFKALSGLVHLREYEPLNWRLDDAGLVCLREADNLEMVYSFGPEVTDAGFTALADKPNLGVINLHETKITDASYKLLENHPELYWLQCSSPYLTDAAIDSAVTIPRLRDLHLNGSKVTDAGVERLVAAIDQLPRLRTVNVSGTQVSQAVADKLRAAKDGLRVLGGVGKGRDDKDEQAVEGRNDDGKSEDPSAAPAEVPWPKERVKTFAKYPPSGSGIRVALDDRRWVELNSLSSYPKRDSGDPKVFWKPNGTFINPPVDFDPLSLVPDEEDGSMPDVTREAAIQIVGPTGTEFSLRSGGGGGYRKFSLLIDNEFTQIPIQYPMSRIQTNHTYIEVRVTQEDWQSVPVDGNDDIQVVMVPDEHRMVVVAERAADYAWKAQVQLDGDEKSQTFGPFTAGVNLDSDFLSESIQRRLADSPPNRRAVIFAFHKKRPFPKILSLSRSAYDVIRFDNLSVYPGPKSAVKVSVNGVPVSDADRLTLVEHDDVPPIVAPPVKRKEDGFIKLTSTIVDADGKPVPNCWVGMFVAPQYFNERKADESAFEPSLRFVIETTTDREGRFTMLAPKDHFVFDGSFWAIAKDGTSGVQRLNCVWSYLRKNLSIELDEDTAEVKIVDPNGNPVAGAEVVPEAIRHNRRPTHHFPTRVREELRAVTDKNGTIRIPGWSSGGIRGIAVTAEGFGTQYLNPQMASQWVEDGEPLTLALRPVASLSGRVIGFDPQRDRSLKFQIRTEAYEKGARPPLSGRAIVSVASDGSFQVPQIVEGYVTLDASTPPDSDHKVRFASIPRLKIGEDRKLADSACPEIVSAVTVRQQLIKSDTRDGAANIKLRILWGDALNHRGSWNSSKPTVTDEDGWWEAKVLPGTINVRINGIPKGYEGTAWFDGRNGYFGVEHTVPETDRVVILPPEVYVPAIEMEGQLLLPDGNPAADWSAYGHPVSWVDVGIGGVRTDKNGNFTWTYPTGYPPRLFNVSNRTWLTEHDFKDNYAYPEIVSEAPFVLQIPEKQ